LEKFESGKRCTERSAVRLNKLPRGKRVRGIGVKVGGAGTGESGGGAKMNAKRA